MRRYVKIAVVDNWCIYQVGISSLLKEFHYRTIMKADSILDLQDRLQRSIATPDTCLIKMGLLEKDDLHIIGTIKLNYPAMRLLGYSYTDDPCEITQDHSILDGILPDLRTPEELDTLIRHTLNLQKS